MMKIETGEQFDFWEYLFVSKMQRLNQQVNAIDSFHHMESEEKTRALGQYSNCWATLDAILFVIIVVGNVLTILAVRLTRALRQVRSNLFILNLAISDLIIGLALPYHLAFYMDETLAKYKLTCIIRFVALNLACSSSTYSLFAIAIDRYVAVAHPLKYNRYFTKTTVLIIIFFGWFYSIALCTVPTYWNNYDDAVQCEYETIVPRYYTLTIVCPVVSTIWLSMFILYWRIWRATKNHARRLKVTGYTNPDLDDCKGAKVALLVLGCFSICWLPYLILAGTRFFYLFERQDVLYKALFSLAMANSGMNPIIYGWKNRKFRKAFYKLLHFQRPNDDFNKSLKDYLQKQEELTRRGTY